MERKEFISAGLGWIAGCCAAACSATVSLAEDRKAGPPQSPETPCAEKVAYAENWAKRFMKVMDTQLNGDQRRQIMEGCGKRCFGSSHADAKSAPSSLEELLRRHEKWAGKENARQEGNTVYIGYPSKGKCLCPIVKGVTHDMPDTYCFCSAGYVQAMLEAVVKKPVKVEILETLFRGNPRCRFKAEIS